MMSTRLKVRALGVKTVLVLCSARPLSPPSRTPTVSKHVR